MCHEPLVRKGLSLVLTLTAPSLLAQAPPRVLEVGAPVYAVAFHRYQQTVASGDADGRIRLWDLQPATARATMRAGHGIIWSIDFSRDGRILANGNDDGTISLWQTGGDHRLLRTLRGHTAAARAVAFSRNGRTLASGSFDRSIRLWNPRNGQLIRTLGGDGGVVWTVAFSPVTVTLLASGEYGGTVRLWNTGSGELIRTLSAGSGTVTSLAFSPDGRFLASASSDGRVRLWNAESGALLRELTVSREGRLVYAVMFLQSSRLVTGDQDGAVKLWSAETGQLVRTLSGHRDAVWSLGLGEWSADLPSDVADAADVGVNLVLLSGSTDRTVRLWSRP